MTNPTIKLENLEERKVAALERLANKSSGMSSIFLAIIVGSLFIVGAINSSGSTTISICGEQEIQAND